MNLRGWRRAERYGHPSGKPLTTGYRGKVIGKELVHDPALSGPERLYVRIFGIPINGLRIRAWRVLPYIDRSYGKILDTGCGQGVFTFEIARRLPESTVTGMDIDSGLIERNRRLAEAAGVENCRFEPGDIMDIPPEEEYDLVLSVDVLEHIEDDERALRSFFGALRRGGDLILHVPAHERRWFLFRWRENFDVEGHFRPGYRMEEIAGKVERAGFTILEKHFTYGWLETVANNVSYLITRARMKRKRLYALVFPFLLGVSYLGRGSMPRRGAGIFIKARKM